MPYVDGFLLAVPKRNMKAYRRIASAAGKVWREYGALEYVECAADSLVHKADGKTWHSLFPKMVKAKPGETVVFSYIVYKSRRARDGINKKVMSDPRLAALMDPKKMPFDMKRMAWGGFKPIVVL